LAQTEFTGKDMTLSVAGGTSLAGLVSVTINEDGGPDTEQLDATVCGDSTYTYIPDPLGGKGSPKSTLTIMCQDSCEAFATNVLQTLVHAGGAVAFAAGVTQYDNTWVHAGMTLSKRTTKITYASPIATCELVYEANSLGTWGSVA
jgi:hypothetical protein